MKMVDENSPEKVSMQVRNLVLEEIRKGVYLPQQRIPSERVLSESYGASRSSVREAIAQLISEGVLLRAGARGTFVSERPGGRGPAGGGYPP